MAKPPGVILRLGGFVLAASLARLSGNLDLGATEEHVGAPIDWQEISKGALLFFNENAGAHSCTVQDFTNPGAGIQIQALRSFPIALFKHAPRRATLVVVRRALEKVGVEFVDENGGGAGCSFAQSATLDLGLSTVAERGNLVATSPLSIHRIDLKPPGRSGQHSRSNPSDRFREPADITFEA
jgi:hypothetical protein